MRPVRSETCSSHHNLYIFFFLPYTGPIASGDRSIRSFAWPSLHPQVVDLLLNYPLRVGYAFLRASKLLCGHSSYCSLSRMADSPLCPSQLPGTKIKLKCLAPRGSILNFFFECGTPLSYAYGHVFLNFATSTSYQRRKKLDTN